MFTPRRDSTHLFAPCFLDCLKHAPGAEAVCGAANRIVIRNRNFAILLAPAVDDSKLAEAIANFDFDRDVGQLLRRLTIFKPELYQYRA